MQIKMHHIQLAFALVVVLSVVYGVNHYVMPAFTEARDALNNFPVAPRQ